MRLLHLLHHPLNNQRLWNKVNKRWLNHKRFPNLKSKFSQNHLFNHNHKFNLDLNRKPIPERQSSWGKPETQVFKTPTPTQRAAASIQAAYSKWRDRNKITIQKKNNNRPLKWLTSTLETHRSSNPHKIFSKKHQNLDLLLNKLYRNSGSLSFSFNVKNRNS